MKNIEEYDTLYKINKKIHAMLTRIRMDCDFF